MRAALSRSAIGLVGVTALAAGLLGPPAASSAAPGGDGLVISEAYLNGGSSDATYRNKHVQIANPTDAPVSVRGWSVQYRSATSTGKFSGVIDLGDHTIPAGGQLLVGGNSNGASGADNPEPDVASGIAFSGSAGGTLALVRSGTALNGEREAVLGDPTLVDLVGYGTSGTYEGSGQAQGYSVRSAIARDADRTDTDDNAADFSAQDPSPEACGAACDGDTSEPGEPQDATIAQVQGEGAESPLLGQSVRTRGVVTAVYPEGGFDGLYLQTEGTGGEIDLGEHAASDGIFVYSASAAAQAEVGDHLEVTGTVGEYYGLTQLVPQADGWQVLDDPAEAVKPATVDFPLTVTERESLEGMLVAPANDFTITDNYQTHQYGQIGLAAGDTPLAQPTDVARPGSAEYEALVVENAQRAVSVDDGATTNFLTGANREIPVPWLTAGNEVRVGARATVTEPMILDFRNDTWKLQPTGRLTAGDEEPLSIEDSTRPAEPADVGGDLRVATFNVLNYFTTLGEEYAATGKGDCTYYADRAGENLTVDSCANNGPRGAANQASFERQEAKIVAAIDRLDAAVVSLEEIENSAAFGEDRDTALRALVGALNDHAGEQRWAFVSSPEEVPEDEDVIRTAFIYQPDEVAPVADSVIWQDPAFANAREPLSQEFRPAGSDEDDDFLVIVNHFKSKGSGSGEDADQGDGQGSSNASRVRQATSLVAFAESEQQRADTELVFLTGDFNAYSEEDPVQVIEDAGYVNVPAEHGADPTYQFGGQMGSLDHVFASSAAAERVTGGDVWTINAEESIAREYSRFNQNVTQLYDTSPYRASDHNPAVIGMSTSAEATLDLSALAEPVRWPKGPVVDVSAHGDENGAVLVKAGWLPIGVGYLSGGEARVPLLPVVLGPGRHSLDVHYLGGGGFGPDRTSVDVEVRAR